MSNTERRQFFRANCYALIDSKQVDKTTCAQTPIEEIFADNHDLDVLNEFQQIDQECTQIARNLNKLDRNLLDYLDLTQRKINRLSQLVLAHLPGLNSLPRQPINLSEAGVAFCSDRLFYLDAILALRLVFLPHYQSVVLFAKVVRCEASEGSNGSDSLTNKRDTYHIALEFLPLTEPTRRVIAQQVLRVQREAKLKAGSDSANPDPANNRWENFRP